jgi:hypothetical protein
VFQGLGLIMSKAEERIARWADMLAAARREGDVEKARSLEDWLFAASMILDDLGDGLLSEMAWKAHAPSVTKPFDMLRATSSP